MMTFERIYKIYKKVGIYNFLLESLANENVMARNYAIKEIAKLNFKTEDDVMIYIGMNI